MIEERGDVVIQRTPTPTTDWETPFLIFNAAPTPGFGQPPATHVEEEETVTANW